MRFASSWRWSLDVPCRVGSVLAMMTPAPSITSIEPAGSTSWDRRIAAKREPAGSISPATSPMTRPDQSRTGT